jgi:hypothetical protein
MCSTWRAKAANVGVWTVVARPVRVSRTKRVGVVDAGEDEGLVLEVVEAGQVLAVDQIGEVVLGGVVHGDAGGYDEAGVAVGGEQVAVVLGEEGVGVDVAAAAQGEAAAGADQVGLAAGLADSLLPAAPEGRIFAGEGCDRLLSGGGVGGGGDLWGAGGEEFLLLQLDPLPGRVAEDQVEAAVPAVFGVLRLLAGWGLGENLGEGEVPVEEVVFAAERFGGVAGEGRGAVGGCLNFAEEPLGGGVLLEALAGWVALFGPDEAGCEDVSDEEGVPGERGGLEGVVAALFGFGGGEGVVGEAVDRGGFAGELGEIGAGGGGGGGGGEEAVLDAGGFAGALVAVAPSEGFGGGFVVAFDLFKGVVGDPSGEQRGRGAEEGVAVEDVGVEEGEGAAGVDRFEP